MPKGQQKIRQHRNRPVAQLAEPAQKKTPLIISSFARTTVDQ
jgi:hypothetical protein